MIKLSNIFPCNKNKKIKNNVVPTSITRYTRDVFMYRNWYKTDENGNCVYKKIVAPSGITEVETECKYDSQGRKIYQKTTNRDGDTYEAEFAYDSEGHRVLTKIKDINKNGKILEYNATDKKSSDLIESFISYFN